MEPRSNIEKPKDRKVKRQKNQKTEDMEIIEIKKDQHQYISEIAALESDIFPDPWSEKSIRDTLENPQARIWAIISRQAPPCSCASTAPEHAGKPQLLLDEGEIARIATSPQHRRQGVAVRLLEKMRAFSYEQNITRWLLDVRISNETAIHFYKAAGFAKDGVRKNFYANPPEACPKARRRPSLKPVQKPGAAA